MGLIFPFSHYQWSGIPPGAQNPTFRLRFFPPPRGPLPSPSSLQVTSPLFPPSPSTFSRVLDNCSTDRGSGLCFSSSRRPHASQKVFRTFNSLFAFCFSDCLFLGYTPFSSIFPLGLPPVFPSSPVQRFIILFFVYRYLEGRKFPTLNYSLCAVPLFTLLDICPFIGILFPSF